MGLVVILAGIVVFGLGLIAVGLVGRRIAPTTRCRRCHFDLSGHADRTQPCPECGQDLVPPRAMYVHRRQRRVVVLWLGSALLATCVVLAAAAYLPIYNSPAVMASKPAWLLRIDAGVPRMQDAALQEYGRRNTAGTLSNDDLRSIALDGIAIPRDQRASAWMDLIEMALLQPGIIPQDAMERYVKSVNTSQVEIPDKAWKGDKIVVRRTTLHSRSGSRFTWSTKRVVLRWNGSQFEHDATANSIGDGNLVDIPPDAADELHGHVEFTLGLHASNGTQYEWKETVTISLRTVPHGTSLVEVVPADAPGVSYDIRCPCIVMSGESAHVRLESPFEVHALSVPLVAFGEFMHRKSQGTSPASQQPLFRLNFRPWKAGSKYPYKFQSLSRRLPLDDYPDIMMDERLAIRLVPDVEMARRRGVWRIIGPIELEAIDYVNYYVDNYWPPRYKRRH